jgi:Ran GTPase-activating protein (RanGAP) involved in mRNA processing and transport
LTRIDDTASELYVLNEHNIKFPKSLPEAEKLNAVEMSPGLQQLVSQDRADEDSDVYSSSGRTTESSEEGGRSEIDATDEELQDEEDEEEEGSDIDEPEDRQDEEETD